MKSPLPPPLTFEPLFQERAWGGRRLESAFGKKLPLGKQIGESWEIVDRPEAQSVVRQGSWRGRTLHELWSDQRQEIFGDGLLEAPRFPILAKLLDAREKLSLQVHPGAEIAAGLGGEPKTEMWYFAATDPGAEIFAGLRRGVERGRLEQAVRDGEGADLVHRIAPRTGDAFFVPSGRLHAIGAGNLLIEIQQNSDTTFRLFDWNRGARDGAPRPLQISEALQSIHFDDFEPELIRPEGARLVRCPYFEVEKWDLDRPRPASERGAFALFVCLSGALEANGLCLAPGEFFLVPANAAATVLQPAAPATSLLRITLPVR
ncbi:MAG: type I phosphomannose isomerase catalytic subunit [Spartobacteria bacterium]